MKGLTHWHEQISFKIAWLLQLSTAVTFFFLLFIMGKYGHIRLGRPGEKPEFSFVATLALLLAAGGGPGMIIFSAVGPSANRFGNFFGQPGYRSQDEVDMFAINTSVFEWGILLWTRFALVAVAVSLAGHRFGLPLTIRSCFYPMLGAYTWGWIGDVIDGVAVVTVVAGSALVMCYAIVQIVICFAYLGWMDRESSADDVKMMQNLSIWVATILSTASVISGLRGGIRFFSRAAIGLCTLLVFVIFIMDDTKFLLNLQVQEVGYHLQTSLFQLNFWTDAFGQLRPGSGRAIDGGAADESWYRTTFALYHSAS